MTTKHNKEWVLIADITNVGKKRLKVLEKDSATKDLTSTVDSQTLEKILASCSAAAVKEVEQLLSLSTTTTAASSNDEDQQTGSDDNDSILLSKVLLRYAVLSDAFRREQQANDILESALETSLKAVDSAKNELAEVKAERDALKQALSMKY